MGRLSIVLIFRNSNRKLLPFFGDLAMHLIPLIQLLATFKGVCGPDRSAVPQFLSQIRSMVIAEAVALVRGAASSSRQGNKVHS